MNNTGRLDKIIITAVFALCAAILVAISFRNTASFDAYWHLKMGLDLIENGLSPYVDHYSFTYGGQEITGPPVVFQVVFATFVKFFGEIYGFHLFKVVAYILFLGAVFIYFRQIRAHWFVVLCILPAIVFFIELRAIVRPELLSYTLIVVALLLYHRAREEFSPARVLPILVMLVVWVNYHSPVFGYIIFFGLYFEKGLQKLLAKDTGYSWGFLLGSGVLIFLSGFANADGSHFIFGQLSFSQEWFSLIQEYKSSIEKYHQLELFYAFWAAFVITLSILIYNKQYGLALVCVIVAFNAWKFARIVTPAALIVLLTLSAGISSDRVYAAIARLGKGYKRAGVLVIVLFSGMSFYNATNFLVNSLKSNEYYASLYPTDIVKFLSETNTGGNILNQYGIGGYLIYHLSPEYKVYIDGRTNILYPLEFMKRYYSLFKLNENLGEEVKKYNIDYILVKLSRDKFYPITKGSEFRTHIVGSDFVLFSKDSPAFPVSGRLMMLPMCWDSKYQGDIEKEINRKTILSSKSALMPVLDVLEGYEAASDKKGYFDTYSKAGDDSDYARRLAAYMALKEGYHQQSADLFYNIRVKESMDFYLMASELMKVGKYEDVEKILHFAIYGKWSKEVRKLKAIDKAIIYTLLYAVQNKRELKIFDSDIMEVLKKEVNGKYPLPLPRIYPDSVCL